MSDDHRLSPACWLGLVAALLVPACGEKTSPGSNPMSTADATPPADSRLATFGAGCFWCVEAVFAELEGVVSVQSGYAGGTVENPTYEAVCSGATGHAEVIQIRYDPGTLRYEDLLEVFWKTHDPTTRDQQGADVGTQYRSAVFFHDEEQRKAAETIRQALDASGAFAAPIVTEITAFERFYPAEAHHQDYYARNPDQGYCRAVIRPKVEKFRRVFAERRKTPR